MYKAARPWEESQASWTQATSTVRWSNAGGDYNPSAVATARFNQTAATGDEFDILSAVRDFVRTPSSNNGFIIVNTQSSMGKVWASSEYANRSRRPRVVVVYDDGQSGVVYGRQTKLTPLVVPRTAGVAYSIAGRRTCVGTAVNVLLEADRVRALSVSNR